MTIVKPYNIQEFLLSSNIQEDSVKIWSSTDIYSVDDEIRFNGKIYISMSDNNQGKQPDISPLRWDYTRPANEVALFDEYPSTISTNQNDDIILEVTSDDATIIALGNLEGNKLKLELTEVGTDTQIEYREINLFEYDEPQDIYDYFFTFPDLEDKRHYIGTFGPYWKSKLKITITKDTSSNNSSIGFIQLGTKKQLGCTVVDTVKFVEKSGIELQRINGKLIPQQTIGYSQLSIPVFIERLQDIYPIRKELSKYKGKPIVILGDDTGENLAYTIIGIYTEIEESISRYGEYTIIVNSMDETI